MHGYVFATSVIATHQIACAKGRELSSLRCVHSTSLAFRALFDPDRATLQLSTCVVVYLLPPSLQLTKSACARGIELSSLRCKHSTSLAFPAWIDPICATLQVLNLYGQGIEARNRMLELILPGKIVFLRPRKVCFCCHELRSSNAQLPAAILDKLLPLGKIFTQLRQHMVQALCPRTLKRLWDPVASDHLSQ